MTDLKLTIPAMVYQNISSQCITDYPNETCGFLLGHVSAESSYVTQLYPIHNSAPAKDKPHYYQMSSAEVLAAQKFADHNKLVLIGVYHSHPDHPAEPSATDRELAWENLTYLIVQITKQQRLMPRAWRLFNNQFIEQQLAITK